MVSDGGWAGKKKKTKRGTEDSEKRLRGPAGETSENTAGGLGAGLVSKKTKYRKGGRAGTTWKGYEWAFHSGTLSTSG